MINIKIDSRKIVPGDTFVALKGSVVDGHDFINSAIANGATKVVCEYGEYDGAEIIKVEDAKAWLDDYLVKNYSDEFNDKLTFIGVTGTNGKTSTCYLAYQTLIQMGVNACYIGTIGYYDKTCNYKLPNTTLNILDFYAILESAIEKGITHVVMEVSSHSLVEDRIKGIKYESLGFTNLTPEHLDFHINMENYLQAKLLILNYLDGKIIVNGDDEYSSHFINDSSVTFGFGDYDLSILNYEDIVGGSKITFKYENKTYEVTTKLKNKLNAYNYIMSVLLINVLGFSIDEIVRHSETINPPAGRCEVIRFGSKEIIIDYAHTPDSYRKIISSFNEFKKGKLITLFGCGGDRDKTKRPIMGSIATELSDFVFITSDNPRTEDEMAIVNDILEGIKKDNYKVILDREEGMKKAIDMLEDNDMLLILGKGHETYQIYGREKVHFVEKDIINEYIKDKK